MSNKIEVDREQLRRWLDDIETSTAFEATREMRALLAAPAVERQEPVAYLRQSDLVRLNQPHVAGCAASLNKEPAAGFMAIYTSLPAPVAVVREGWKLVPIEPTDDMIVALAEAWYSKRQTIDDPDMLDAYCGMLAVAPAYIDKQPNQ